MNAWWDELLCAVANFSVLPVPARSAVCRPTTASLLALPLVGALIGAISGGAAMLIAFVAGRDVALASAFILQLGLTGAIHIDGFLDMCDAAIAPVAPARRFEILKDPRHGTFAVVGMALLTVLWLTALGSSAISALPAVLAFSGAASRLCAIAMTPLFSYAGSTAESPLTHAAMKWQIAIGFVLLLAIGAFISARAFAAPIAGIVVSYLLSEWMARRFGGGLTGDSYGFLIGVLEPFVLLILVAHP